MTSQVRSKSKGLTIWRIWFCRVSDWPYKMETSQYNYMERVWDTSKYDPKLSGSTYIQGQGHSRSRGQGTVELKKIYSGRVIRVLRPVFRQEREKLP